jgi:hypothetical protein
MSNPGPNIVAESLTRGEAVVTATITPASIAAGASTAFTSTVSGVAAGDHVSVSGATGVAAYAVAAYVSAANTVTIVINNPSAGALTPSNSTYLVRVTRPFPVASSVTTFGVNDPMNAGAIPLSS